MIRYHSKFRALVVSVFLWVLTSLSMVQPLPAQTSDEAVTNQLDFGPALTIPCFELLDGGILIPADEFTGSLVLLCTRGAPLPGASVSSATGGGAATPTVLPSILQKRMREARDEEGNPKVTGASADAVVELDSGFGLFISGEFESLDRDITTFQDGFHSDIWRVTAGADYQFARWIVGGLALDYHRHDGDFKGGGGFQTDSYGILGFASFQPLDDVFVQVSGGWARKDYDRSRLAVLIDEDVTTGDTFVAVSGLLNSDYLGNEFRAGALGGYDFHIEKVIIGARAGFDWVRSEFKAYSERGRTIESFGDLIALGDETGLELTIHADEVTSLQTRLGLQASVALSTGWGDIVPHVGFDWRYEFENDQRDLVFNFVGDKRAKPFTFQTEPPDRNWFELNAGAVMELKNKVQIFANYRTMLGHSFFDSHAATIGVRFPL